MPSPVPTGAVKTTLAKLIMGINPNHSRRYLFSKEKESTDLSITDRARAGISYSFQQPARFKGAHLPGSLGARIRDREEANYWHSSGVSGSAHCPFWINRSIPSSPAGEIKKMNWPLPLPATPNWRSTMNRTRASIFGPSVPW